ncbi:NUDIX domain-containing protein [Spirosoma sp. HMF4905]|uniref:NUDIX domain-containing protein n=1 Tax=Spirosoma arboris TaxID=2682092 RepID=A0A7K1SD13_9BACT|nr:NUDIX domain-containing protein [Spirosoma arboris]MVM31702.1 NUDIX domain-containing protein [Spirosoma arboris]
MKKLGDDDYISHLSIDCVIFGYQDKELKVLISKFKFGKGSWSLPGGYILKTEGIDKAASRILKERTGLESIYLEQFRVFGDENRIATSRYKEVVKSELNKFDEHRFTPEVTDWMTSRFVCIGYYALVDINKVNPQAGEFDEYLEWRSIKDIPEMIHDHSEILTFALEALRQNLDQKLIGFNLLPETFTMREVQELYEAVYNRPFVITNFQKKILDLNVLERLEKKYTGAANKAPYLYRFRK